MYAWYGERLFRQVILPRLPSQELAEDCLRDTFRVVLEKIGQFSLVDRSMFFWMRRIAIHKAIDIYRREKRDSDLSDRLLAEEEATAGPGPSPEEGLEQDDLRRDIETSLTRLNERYATALRLRLLEERSREECAAAMDVSLGNFDVILHRAAKAFRQVYPP